MKRLAWLALAAGAAACGATASLEPPDAAPVPDAPVVVFDAFIADAFVADAVIIDADETPDREDIPDADDTDAEVPDANLPDAARPDATPLDAGGPAAGGVVHCARSMGGAGADLVIGLEVATDGSVVATGSFSGSATFGKGEALQTVLTADGSAPDIFVARFDADCKLVWAKRAGGPGGDSGTAVAVAADGSVYVTGAFSQTAAFDARSVTAQGLTDVFVAHYTAAGAVDWVSAAGGADSEGGAGVAEAGGKVYVTGSFRGTAMFGSTPLTASGTFGGALFVARYTSTGALVWAKQAGDGTAGGVSGTRIAAAGDDAVVTGNFRGAPVFGTGEAAATTLTSTPAPDSTPSTDAFVARYTQAGALAWAKRAGGAGFDAGGDVTAAADGSILLTGSFGEANGASAPATFGPGETGQVVLTSDGGIADVFVARYAGADGKLVFAKRAGGPSHDVGYAIRATSAGFLVAGTFGGPDDGGFAVFGSAEPNKTTLVARGGYDMFVALFAADGKLTWAREAGGTTVYDQATSVAVSASGDLLVGGRFGGTAFFDSTGVGPAGGTTDGFVTSYRP